MAIRHVQHMRYKYGSQRRDATPGHHKIPAEPQQQQGTTEPQGLLSDYFSTVAQVELCAGMFSGERLGSIANVYSSTATSSWQCAASS
jgi:hypothetical protein